MCDNTVVVICYKKKNLSTCFPEGGWVRVKRNLLSMYVAYGLPIPCKWPESLSMYTCMYVCYPK